MGITTRVGKGVPLTHEELDANFAACMGLHNFMHVQDKKAVGVNGGTFTSGAWRTRELNTVVLNAIQGAALASNLVTLPAGSYYAEASAPALQAGWHAIDLYNVTNTARLILCSQAYDGNANYYAQTRSFLSGSFVLGSQSNIQLRHWGTTTVTNSGFGGATAFEEGIFSDLKIWKLS